MRIACVHVPQFALQTLTRIDPSLRGAAVAVVGAGSDLRGPAGLSITSRAALSTPVVQACSRAAWALGVRIGMTATAANALPVPPPSQLRVVTAEPQLEREAVRALADALLSVSAVVDAGGRVGAGGAHLAMYCEVPSKTRGASYGDRLLEVLAALGVTARIGIADDRFTAWVAAAHGGAVHEESGVVSVPRGGSAAFLSPRPLSLLAITPEVQHMLEALGVCTLGEFAALPAPSVARPLEADYQALARGESGHAMRPYVPESPIREELVVASAGSAVATLAERVALRLQGRARGAAKLEVTLAGPTGERVVAISPLMAPLSSMATAPAAGARVLESAEQIAEALGAALGDAGGEAVWRLRVAVTGEAIAGDVAANENAVELADAAMAPPIDALSVVLANTGSAAMASGAWNLTPGSPATLRSERRDAHRRTRRGKQRRGVREQVAQARLFLDRSK